jgi:hypothetical protein
VMLPMVMNSHLRPYLPAKATGVWDAALERLRWPGVGALVRPVSAAPQVEVEAQKNS